MKKNQSPLIAEQEVTETLRCINCKHRSPVMEWGIGCNSVDYHEYINNVTCEPHEPRRTFGFGHGYPACKELNPNGKCKFYEEPSSTDFLVGCLMFLVSITACYGVFRWVM